MDKKYDIKTPPALKDDISYESWKKEISIWQRFTTLDKKKQGLAIFLSLDGKAREIVLELDIEVMNNDDGVEKVLEQLDKLYLKDKMQLSYQAYDAFEKFKRPEDMAIADFVVEFERLYNKAKAHDMVLPDGILAYKFLNNANISESHEKLVRATMPNLTYKAMKDQLRKVFGDLSLSVASNKAKVNTTSSMQVKVEPSDAVTYEVAHEDQAYEVNFGSHKASRSNRSRGRGNFRGRSRGYRGQNYHQESRAFEEQPRRNPPKADGSTSTCAVCGSIFHWAKDCPDSYENKLKKSDGHISLYSDTMKHFVGETLGAAVLDSGCTKNVCGETWLQCYLESLNEENKAKVVYSKSTTNFRFGAGEKVQSIKVVRIPAVLGSRKVTIETEVIKGDLPLLLSREAMKKAEMNIDFRNDSVEIFGEKRKLLFTSSGHYCIPLGQHYASTNIDKEEVVLYGNWSTYSMEDKKNKLIKLHRQFSHASYQRLEKLLKDAGIVEEDMFHLLQTITESCRICKQYKKTPARPVVGLSLAHVFNDTIAMDLKEWKEDSRKTWFLHLIDHATRYSASSVIHSKRKEVIVEEIFKIWIRIFGHPKKVLVDNGGEFDNSEFIDFCENMNIKVKTTAAESPWSNGMVERHNGVIGESVTKIMNEVDCSLEIALSWALSAKNSLQNFYGFSPNQLVFGRNPNFPSVIDDKLPALEGKTQSEVVGENLNAMHSARKAFIAAEASEKIRRALRHNVRTTGDVKYFTGDLVFYKRNNSEKWKGPGTVIGQDGQQVLVKHGSTYVRVHPCRLQLENPEINSSEITKTELGKNVNKCTTFVNEDETDESDGEAAQREDVNVTITRNSDQESEKVETQSSVPISRNSDQGSEKVGTQRSSMKNLTRSKNTGEVSRPKVKQTVTYLPVDCDEWTVATVMSKAGKNGGKYENWLNVKGKDGVCKSIDWENGVREWQLYEENEEIDKDTEELAAKMRQIEITKKHVEEQQVLFTSSTLDPCLVAEAQEKELESWRVNNVYNEVQYTGQNCISTRWVYTEKYIDGIKVIKARLVARGYEETEELLVDSPTCSKECLRLASTIIASNEWICHGIDVKTAFLQGKNIERNIFVEPPEEAKNDNNIIWKLNVCVYGLSDASRNWYIRVKEELLRVGVGCCRYDPGLFYWHSDGKIHGIITIHVDDLLWGGTKLFEEVVINAFKQRFKIGKECCTAFKYLGLQIIQENNSININQINYSKSIQPIDLSKERRAQKNLPLGKEELKKLRVLIGQMNWIATQTRPDILFDCCELASNIKNAKIEDILKANKVLKKLKDDVTISFPKLNFSTNLKLLVYADASYANLKDGGSQGGYVIFMTDGLMVSPIAWQSKRIKRVVKSTLAAETLALVEASEASLWIQCVIKEVLNEELSAECFTDSKSLYEASYSMTNLLDKRLRIDIAIIREMLEKKEIEKVNWIPTKEQLADCLTKRGSNPLLLLQAMTANQI